MLGKYVWAQNFFLTARYFFEAFDFSGIETYRALPTARSLHLYHSPSFRTTIRVSGKRHVKPLPYNEEFDHPNH